MNKTLLYSVVAALVGLQSVALRAQTIVGVSWSNFQEERWKTDEAAIRAQLAQERRQVHQRRRRRARPRSSLPTSTA